MKYFINDIDCASDISTIETMRDSLDDIARDYQDDSLVKALDNLDVNESFSFFNDKIEETETITRIE